MIMKIKRKGLTYQSGLPDVPVHNKDVQLKGYVFQNFYLTGTQIGIQAAHSVARLVFRYEFKKSVEQWVLNDETLVVLNGGDHVELEQMATDLSEYVNRMEKRKYEPLFYFSYFKEPGVNESFTNVFVLPSIECMEAIQSLPKNKKLVIQAHEYEEDHFRVATPCGKTKDGEILYNELISGLSEFEAEMIVKISRGRLLK